MIRRRALFTLALGLPLLARQATAQTAPSAPIQALNDALLQVMKTGKSSPFASRMATLTPVVQKVFNLPTLLKNSVGPARWNTIAEAQKTELLDVFTQFTVASYVGNFDAFNGETLTVAPETRKVGNDVVVATRLTGTAGDVTKIDYQMHEAGGTWKVVDILLDGAISRVAVTRSDFRALLAQGSSPADASPLIASLRSKAASLAAGNAS